MKKFVHKLLLLLIILTSSTSVFAAKIPDDIKEYIDISIPGTYIRFDGIIILPDNTIYLPLFPSLFSDVKSIQIKESYPKGQSLDKKPNIVIFNNEEDIYFIGLVENGNESPEKINFLVPSNVFDYKTEFIEFKKINNWA